MITRIAIPKDTRRLVVRRAGQRCERCETGRVDLVINHIRPVVFGGGNEPENLELICPECHKTRHQEAVEQNGERVQGHPGPRRVKGDATAERQRRFRNRRNAELKAYREGTALLLAALTTACQRGRCSWLTNHLPDDPHEALDELTRRLANRRLIVCRPER